MEQRLRSLLLALTNLPDAGGWLRSIAIFLVFLALAAPFGLRMGLLRFHPLRERWSTYLWLPALLFLKPALLEELVFRALLLPHPSEGLSSKQVFAWALVSLIIFVLWHPLNALVFRPEVKGLFTQANFLALASLMGAACTAAYLSCGSLWPPVLIHWVAVVTWMLLLGGWELPGVPPA